MPAFIAQRIHNGHKIGDAILFTADADPTLPGDTDIKAACRIADDGIDPFSGIWVEVLAHEDEQ